MSAADPGEATGTGHYPPIWHCTCGHLDTVHRLDAGKPRTTCTANGCPCKKPEPRP